MRVPRRRGWSGRCARRTGRGSSQREGPPRSRRGRPHRCWARSPRSCKTVRLCAQFAVCAQQRRRIEVKPERRDGCEVRHAERSPCVVGRADGSIGVPAFPPRPPIARTRLQHRGRICTRDQRGINPDPADRLRRACRASGGRWFRCRRTSSARRVGGRSDRHQNPPRCTSRAGSAAAVGSPTEDRYRSARPRGCRGGPRSGV